MVDSNGYEVCGFDKARMTPSREAEIGGETYVVFKCTANPIHTKTVPASEVK